MSSIRQLAAIMFTDIVGYTSLMQKNEAAALDKLHRFKEELSHYTKFHRGDIIQYYGDGCLIIFPNSNDAVSCAKSLQEAFRDKLDIPVRIGIHLGDILIEDGNIFGDSVNISSRIESMGVPGSVLVSDAIRNQIKNKSEFILSSLGKFEFKNVDEPMEIFVLANEGFPVPDKTALTGKFKETKTEKRIDSFPSEKKQTGTKKIVVMLLALFVVLAGGYFVYTYFFETGKNKPGTIETNTSNKSIAVLPFSDMSPEKNQEYLGDGLADDIISALSGINNLKVIGRTSSFQFKGKNIDLREIGDKLGVETVLEGSVQKAGNTIRVTAQLINVKDGTHIWSQKWDRSITDIFKVQDEIAQGIKEKFEISFAASSTKITTTNTDAYENYLKGRRLLLTNIPDNVKKARDFFLRALQKDTSFADATAFLSLSYFKLGTLIYPWIEKEKRQKALDSSFSFAQQAISLDDKSAAAHLAMGQVYTYNYEWEKAEKEYRRAHELKPGTVEKNFLADFLSDMGEFDEATQLAKDALIIDPLDINSMITYANIFRIQGLYHEAIQILEKAIKIDSASMKAYAVLGHCYHGIKKDKDCLMAWAKQHEAYGNKELATIYRTSDFKTGLQAWIKQATTPNAPVYSGEYTVAVIYAYFLDKENTFKYLDLAVQNHRIGIVNLKSNKVFDFLKEDPKYKELYHKLRLDEYDEYKKTK